MKNDEFEMRGHRSGDDAAISILSPLARGGRAAFLSELERGKPAPAPVVGVDLLDDDEGRLQRLVEHVEQQLAGALDQRGLFLGGGRVGAGPVPSRVTWMVTMGMVVVLAGLRWLQ